MSTRPPVLASPTPAYDAGYLTRIVSELRQYFERANTGFAAGTNPVFGGSIRETRSIMDTASTIDVNNGAVFVKTITGVTTFTVVNVPAAGTVASFLVDLTNGGAFTVNWWAGVKWAGGTAPTLTASGRDLLGFMTHDGGTTWTGMMLAEDAQ